jgi:hypothetical protein
MREQLPWRSSSIALLFPGALFLYVLLRPVSSNSVLVPVLAGLGLCAALARFVRHGRLTKLAVAILFLQLLHASLSLLIGSLQNAPGLAEESLVLVAAPALFWLCAAAIRPRDIRPILCIVAFASIVISAGIILYVFGERGVLPQLPAGLLGATGAGIGTNGETIAIRFYALSTLVGAAPMLTASIAMPRSRSMPPMNLRFAASGLAILAALLTGRRALVLAMVLTPLVLWAAQRLLPDAPSLHSRESHRRASPIVIPAILALGVVVAVAVAIAPQTFNLSIVRLSVTALNDTALGGQGTQANPVLQDEASRLISAWSQSPVFGHGAGAEIHGYARDPLRPWNFELQYHRLLFYSGLVGLVLFMAVLATCLILLRHAARASFDYRPALVVATVGAVSMLMANASDPYLQAPGHMWAVYLPLGIANAILANNLCTSTERPGNHVRRIPQLIS